MHKFKLSIICAALILGAFLVHFIIVKTAPKAERQRPPKTAVLVETVPLVTTNETVRLLLTGTVVPSEEITLQTRVTGEIISMAEHFIEGGHLKKNAAVLKIDPVDYELALADAQSKLETARFNYKLELGRQDVAQREWELLKTEDATDAEKELALRIPHLAASKAALQAAESALERAELNLKRTEISAPFNAIVLDRNIHIGSQAQLQTQLARLVGTDTAWIMVSIPVDRIEWVTIPGSTVRIISNGIATREGTVIKLLGNLEKAGRMARLLVEVNDPFSLKPENADRKSLLMNEFVRVEIDGRKINEAIKIPREALRENEIIWLAVNDKLEMRSVEVLWRDTEEVLIQDDLEDGTLLVVSDINAPILGMDLNTGKQNDKKPAAEEE